MRVGPEKPCWPQGAVQKCSCCTETQLLQAQTLPDTRQLLVCLRPPMYPSQAGHAVALPLLTASAMKAVFSTSWDKAMSFSQKLCLQRSCACSLSLPNQTEKHFPLSEKHLKWNDFARKICACLTYCATENLAWITALCCTPGHVAQHPARVLHPFQLQHLLLSSCSCITSMCVIH